MTAMERAPLAIVIAMDDMGDEAGARELSRRIAATSSIREYRALREQIAAIRRARLEAQLA
jgi:hypothetical protein